jgi:type I restriction enzyme S subunit
MTREMKNSGVEWIGEIPLDWNTIFAFQCFEQVKNKNTGMIESNLLSLSYGQIKHKSIDTVEGLLPDSFETYNVIEEDDIVLRLTDLQNDHKSLRVGLSNEKGIITSAYLTLRNKSANVTKYLYYYLHSFDLAKGFYGMGSGVRQGLNWDELKHLIILKPNVHEQEHIVSHIDCQCYYIDSIIEKTKASIEEYNKLKQAIITQAVTKGVRGNRPLQESGVVWIGKIPEDWLALKFKYVATVKANLVHPSDFANYPQIAPDNIEKGTSKLLDYKTVREVGVESDNHLFFKGQIIYSKIRPILNKVIIAPFDGLCSADMYPIETTINKRYLVYMMLSDVFLSQVKLVTEDRVKMPKINQEELGQIRICLPQEDEQAEIVEYLDSKIQNINHLIECKEKLLSDLESYKKSMIYEYITGKKEA